MTTLWVCADCLMARESDGSETTDREPWELIPASARVFIGLEASEHFTPCGSFQSASGDFLGGECECAQQPFSWTPCDACGSTLGGTRDAYTLDDDAFSIGRPAHLASDEAYAETARVYAGTVAGEISDACAVTVASWWQGPREGNGLALAEVATAGRVDVTRVLDDIHAAYRTAEPMDRVALDCLATWTINHPARVS